MKRSPTKRWFVGTYFKNPIDYMGRARTEWKCCDETEVLPCADYGRRRRTGKSHGGKVHAGRIPDPACGSQSRRSGTNPPRVARGRVHCCTPLTTPAYPISDELIDIDQEVRTNLVALAQHCALWRPHFDYQDERRCDR